MLICGVDNLFLRDYFFSFLLFSKEDTQVILLYAIDFCGIFVSAADICSILMYAADTCICDILSMPQSFESFLTEAMVQNKNASND